MLRQKFDQGHHISVAELLYKQTAESQVLFFSHTIVTTCKCLGVVGLASLTTVSSAMAVVSSLLGLSSIATRMFGTRAIVIGGCLVNAVLTSTMAYSTSLEILFACECAKTLIACVSEPVRRAFIDSHARADNRGAFVGFVHFFKATSGISSQFLSSFLNTFGVEYPLLVVSTSYCAQAAVLNYW